MSLRRIIFIKCLLSSLFFTTISYGGGSDPIYIYSAPYTINNAGYYALGAVISGTSSMSIIDPLITIEADDVTLDLNGYTLFQNNAGKQCLLIEPGSQNICIKNGYIASNNGIGINAVGSNSSSINNIVVQQVLFYGCTQAVNGAYFNNSHIIGCNFSTNNQAILLNSCMNNVIDNCLFYKTGLAACSLFTSSNNNIRNCFISGSYSDQYCFGIVSRQGSLNTIDRCLIESIGANSKTSLLSAGIGFETEISSNILNCTVTRVTGKNCYGIWVPGMYLLDDFYMNSNDAVARALAWSPDGKYLATCGTDGEQGFLIVYTVVNHTFTNPIRINIGSTLTTVAWAPQPFSHGFYLAVGGQDAADSDDNAPSLVKVYSFDGTHLQLVADLYTQLTNDDCTEDADYDLVNSLSWSSTNEYIAVGGTDEGRKNGFISIVHFVPTSPYLITIAYTDESNPVASEYDGVAWQSGSNYIAASGYTGSSSSGHEMRCVYLFDPNQQTVIKQAAVQNSVQGSIGNSVSWSSDGTYIVFGGTNRNSKIDLAVYRYDTATPSILTLVASSAYSTDFSKFYVESVSWLSDSPYIAAGCKGYDSKSGDDTGISCIFKLDALRGELPLLIQNPETISQNTSIAVQSVAWQPENTLCLALAGVDSSTSHFSLYTLNLNCTMQKNMVNAVGDNGTGIEANNSNYVANYVPNVVMTNAAVANNINYGTMVDWVESDWDDVQYLSNLSWQN